jgi:hypothetical protein
MGCVAAKIDEYDPLFATATMTSGVLLAAARLFSTSGRHSSAFTNNRDGALAVAYADRLIANTGNPQPAGRPIRVSTDV